MRMMLVEESADAGRITIRRAVDADAAGVRRFLTDLSTSTAYHRFFTGLGSVSGRLVAQLLRRDGDRDVLLAIHAGAVVGHAMCAPVPDRHGVVELALVVADAWQRRGVGPLLARTVLDGVLARGVREVMVTILADNDAAIRLVERSWPWVRPVRAGGVCEYVVSLDRPDALSRQPPPLAHQPRSEAMVG